MTSQEKSLKNRKLIEGVLAFCIPATLFLLLCLVHNITPFGDRTFLYEDMKQQYIDFYAYYRAVFYGRDGFFYSAHSGLGADMIGTWTYYLTSPFLLVFLVASEYNFPCMVTIMTMLKIASIGFTTWLFLSNFHTEKEDDTSFGFVSLQAVMAIMCSTAFAYSGFVVANMTNSMWLDVLIIMPLFAISYLRILRHEHKAMLYLVLSVMAMLYANYYIGAITLLFAGIFTIILFLFREIRINDVLRLLGSVFLSITFDLWFLIPSFISLLGSNKDHAGIGAQIFEKYLPVSSSSGTFLSPFNIIIKLFSTSYDSIEIMEGLPNIYFGTALIITSILFFFNKRIKTKKKLIAGTSLSVLILFFCNKYLNVIAHGGTQPYGYLYRYSFLFSFICIILSYEELYYFNKKDYEPARDKYRLISMAISLLITLVLLFISYKSASRLISGRFLITNIFIVFVSFSCMLLVMYSRPIKKYIFLLLGLVLVFDLSVNFSKVYRSSSMMARSVAEYCEMVDEVEESLAYIRENGDDTYRIESLVPMTPNESLHFEYCGITAYNSLLKVENRLLLFRMGFNDNGLYALYEAGNTRTADKLLGIRYIITDGIVKPSDGQIVFSDNILENIYVSKDNIITSDNVKELLGIIEDDDSPFEVQEKLSNYLNHDNANIFVDARIDKKDSSNEKSSYTIYAESSGELYFYLNRVNMEERAFQIYVNGSFVSMYGNASCQKVIDLGYYDKGDTISLEIVTDGYPVLADPIVETEVLT